jgi:hypothetical protein
MTKEQIKKREELAQKCLNQAEIIEKLEKLIKDDTCNSVRETLALISEGEGNNIEVYRQMSKSALNKIDKVLLQIADFKEAERIE